MNPGFRIGVLGMVMLKYCALVLLITALDITVFPPSIVTRGTIYLCVLIYTNYDDKYIVFRFSSAPVRLVSGPIECAFESTLAWCKFGDILVEMKRGYFCLSVRMVLYTSFIGFDVFLPICDL